MASPHPDTTTGDSGGSGASSVPLFEVKKWYRNVHSVALLNRRVGRPLRCGHGVRCTSQRRFTNALSADIVVDNCAICRNHIMDLCTFSCLKQSCSHLRRHRMSGKSECNERRLYCCLVCRCCIRQNPSHITQGHVQPCLSLSLHFSLAQDTACVSTG